MVDYFNAIQTVQTLRFHSLSPLAHYCVRSRRWQLSRMYTNTTMAVACRRYARAYTVYAYQTEQNVRQHKLDNTQKRTHVRPHVVT